MPGKSLKCSVIWTHHLVQLQVLLPTVNKWRKWMSQFRNNVVVKRCWHLINEPWLERIGKMETYEDDTFYRRGVKRTAGPCPVKDPELESFLIFVLPSWNLDESYPLQSCYYFSINDWILLFLSLKITKSLWNVFCFK